MIGYVNQINIRMIYAEVGAKLFQYIAPIVFGIISDKKSIANVSITDTYIITSLPNKVAA